MASEFFIGQRPARPRLFLLLLLLFLILGTCLASAVTGADYVRGNGAADYPYDRAESAPAAFSAQDDRCVLVVFADDTAPQAFLLWRLRPATSAMSVTVCDADTPLTDGETGTVTLGDRFGAGGRIGCEAVCDALETARLGTPAHYLVVTADTLRALMDRLGDTLPVTVPDGFEAVADDYPGAPLTGGRQAVCAEQLIALLSVPVERFPGGHAVYTRLRGEVWATLCSRFFAAARTGDLAVDFAVVADAAKTDLRISHFVLYRDALTALAAQNAGRHCPVSTLSTGS